MLDKNKFSSAIGFTDMLFNILVGFSFLFIVAFLLIRPDAKKEDFERKAEYVIVLEWNHDRNDDIDLYVQDPTNTKCNFRLPIANFMYLDKDDLGHTNDIVKSVNGKIMKVNINREVISIRGIIPGEYVVNAHYYSTRDYNRIEQVNSFEGNTAAGREAGAMLAKKRNKDPLTVKIEVHKVNPYKILWVGEKKFSSKGQEDTFVRFTVDEMGQLVGDFSYEKIKFVTPVMGSTGYSASSVAPHSYTNIGATDEGTEEAYMGVTTP